jgi:hypothetical protein
LGGSEVESLNKSQPEIRKTGLSTEQGRIMKSKLEAHFDTNHPFRKTGYTITDLSKELDIPSYQLSSFINQEYSRNFNELINEYRVFQIIPSRHLERRPDSIPGPPLYQPLRREPVKRHPNSSEGVVKRFKPKGCLTFGCRP